MSNLKLLQSVEIPLFPLKVTLSEARAARYYTKKKEALLPKYMKEGLLKGKYYWKGNYLFSAETKERIIKNTRVAGKPKYFPLSGNAFASGMNPMLRSKIVHELKDYYRPYVRDMKPFTEFPLIVSWEFHSAMTQPYYDLSNMWFYYKYFEDCLHETEYEEDGEVIKIDSPIIPDDDYRYISKPGSPLFVPVDSIEKRKFVFNFYLDNRPEIKEKYARYFK